MRSTAIIALSALTLQSPALAQAGAAGPVAPPAIGTANPAPPAPGSEIPAPQSAKPSLNSGNTALGTNGAVDSQTAGAVGTGADTSTAAPGGRAESTKNGALSTPADDTQIHTAPHKKTKPRPDMPADSGTSK